MAGGVSENLCPNIKLFNRRGILSLWTCSILGNLQFLQLQLKDLSQTTHLIPFRKGEKRSHFFSSNHQGLGVNSSCWAGLVESNFESKKLNDLKLIFQCKLDQKWLALLVNLIHDSGHSIHSLHTNHRLKRPRDGTTRSSAPQCFNGQFHWQPTP